MFKSIFNRSKKLAVVKDLAHDDYFNELRSTEYKRVDEEGHVYLDFTGGNLYSNQQLKKHHALLSKYVLGNPHSSNPT